ncbi:hypothetical protein ACET3X_001789 [Alternaria dauci]|uniref:Uncharacterized protein n=1 Tax=Alternaria dauci TaxID=48095 RepID=A0ABR3UYS0_9PLEO
MLFCIADEAKPFVHKITNHTFQSKDPFYLAESKTCPDEASDFKRKLENSDFSSEFTSVEECQEWMLREQLKHNFMETDFIHIADARSAKDKTLLTCVYSDEPLSIQLAPEGEPEQQLPPKAHTWCSWRIRSQDAEAIESHIQHGEPGDAWPVFYLRKDEITDANGVIDMEKATKMVWGED